MEIGKSRKEVLDSSLDTSNLHVKHIRQALITGTGRSGTRFMCVLLRKVGLNFSHDNDVDCGKFPGELGAVSWYHAFRQHQPRFHGNISFNRILHLVRDPVKAILSRAHTNLTFVQSVVAQRHLPFRNDEMNHVASLETLPLKRRLTYCTRHWVILNSFVEKFSRWRSKIEEISSSPSSSWHLCMAAGLGPKCPPLPVWKDALGGISTTINTEHGTVDKTKTFSWSHLMALTDDRKYLAMAAHMALRYGYHVPESIQSALQLSSLQYHCSFAADDEERSGRSKSWDCIIVGGGAKKSAAFAEGQGSM